MGFPGQVDCEVDHNQLRNAIAKTYAKFHQPCPTFITAISRQPGENQFREEKNNFLLIMIRKVVKQAFQSEYLSSEAELNIRQLYQNCQLDDIDALIDLQQALNYGYLQKQSGISRLDCPNYPNYLVSSY
jgi:hypothetical protein